MIEYMMQEDTIPNVTDIQEEPHDNHREKLAGARLQAPSIDLIKAHITLLEKEVILSQHSDLFRLVQHHYYRLQSWHDQHTGWRIQRTSTLIRLIRHASTMTPGYLYERLKEPKDFACLTWILWYAENRQLSGRGNDQQFLLSQLTEQIQEQSAQTIPGSESEDLLDFRRQTDRYSIQRALHHLEGLGGLQLVDGQTREWVEQKDNADVLYEFTDVARSLVAALNPQLVADVSARLREPSVLLQPTRIPDMNVAPLVRAWRSLLLGPALFKFDDPEAFNALLPHTDRIANELLETFGWLLDIRRNYTCIVRESGSSMGPVSVLTPYGTNDQIALLMCTMIREHITSGAWPSPDTYGCLQVTTEDMTELFYAVRERYGENWGNEARNKASQSLLNDVQRKMRQIGLIRGPDETGTLLILPLAARYSATYDQVAQQQAATSQRVKAKVKQIKQTHSTSK
jgi:uncharacterized protein (TIGR02678 family)